MKFFAYLAMLALSTLASAATPADFIRQYAAEAQVDQPGFTSSHQRGATFFKQRFNHSETLPGCNTCHTDNPLNAGRHAVTGKTIRPLASATNVERFTDPGKVEKWFGRNCKEVLGRACTSAEKADFVTYMSEVR